MLENSTTETKLLQYDGARINGRRILRCSNFVRLSLSYYKKMQLSGIYCDRLHYYVRDVEFACICSVITISIFRNI